MALTRLYLVLFLLAFAGPALAQGPGHSFKYQGAFACTLCHRGPTGRFTPDLIKLDESETWRNEDKHSQAMRLLVGIVLDQKGKASFVEKPEETVGLRMLQRLGVLSEAEYNATLEQARATAPKLAAEDNEQKAGAIELEYMKPIIDKCWESPVGRGCLACHAGVPPAFPPEFDEASFRQFSVPDGVSCEACHGPSDGWDKPHYDKKTWRPKTPADKAKLGFIDVRHAQTRANQCYSCHIGDVSEGKFIEHSWYMAGHPPLPSIEAETFAEHMPRHWRYLYEKPDFKELRDEYVLANFGKEYDAKADHPQTKAVLVGGLVALRKSAALLAEAHTKSKGAVIPDFAAFDCLACHQELRTRPILTRDDKRFDPYIPGRPNIPRWSFALADLAVEVAGGARPATFQTQIDLWRDAMSRQPFGDRTRAAKAAADLKTFLEPLEQSMSRQPLTAADAAAAYKKLREIANTQHLDFHSARQTVWALQIMANDAGQKLHEDLQYAANYEKSKAADYLRFRLPSGTTAGITDPENLPTVLNRIDLYDPETFRKRMSELPSAP